MPKFLTSGHFWAGVIVGAVLVPMVLPRVTGRKAAPAKA